MQRYSYVPDRFTTKCPVTDVIGTVAFIDGRYLVTTIASQYWISQEVAADTYFDEDYLLLDQSI